MTYIFELHKMHHASLLPCKQLLAYLISIECTLGIHLVLLSESMHCEIGFESISIYSNIANFRHKGGRIAGSIYECCCHIHRKSNQVLKGLCLSKAV